MDQYIDDVQSSLQGHESNYREGTQRPPLSYSQLINQPDPTSKFFEPGKLASAGDFEQQQRFPDHQQQYSSQAPVLSQWYHGQQIDVLDDYDRALLAEPESRLSWTRHNYPGTIAPGRLSLPGHTAPYTPVPALEPATAPQRRRTQGSSMLVHSDHHKPRFTAEPSSEIFKTKLSKFLHTSPNQGISNSSPPINLPSSPLFNASQRRPARQKILRAPVIDQFAQSTRLYPATTSNTKKTRTNGLSHNGPDDVTTSTDHLLTTPSASSSTVQNQKWSDRAPPIIQGIQLVSTNNLPDRFRSVFPFDPFNAIQSKCYATAYQSNDNLVLSAPTGGGKTAIFELAICHLISGIKNDQYKIVYMAPTKSLCAERQRDWQAKFAALDLVCAELTGDTDFAHLRSVQSASIVITTPEKWDSMTRQWKDHAKLMQLVKLFLIDEVHMLRENRGATLEAVVSRMKSVGSNVRFIALSATVPNSADVATWLGKDHTSQHLPAVREIFGDEFRPVVLQKHVVGLPYKGNDFGFEGTCDLKQVRHPLYNHRMLSHGRLPDIIARYGSKKPLMVFCSTRKSTQSTAKFLADLWASQDSRNRQWQAPALTVTVSDPALKSLLSSAVAFHHAGLDGRDRHAVEHGFLTGQINVICCTSTLAVGVNLPCHLVIIKNTMSYQNDGLKEYAELDIMQMLGRAGRPQFDDSAVAVIITKKEKARKYEQLITGGELLESCLHLNLIDHLNAEIGLGTVFDLHTVKVWLAGTFLYVRLQKNPEHYKFEDDTTTGDLDERIERICKRDLDLLKTAGLVTIDSKIKATELGHIMARYYVQFKTMRRLLSLGSRSKISDILSSLVQAEEYQEIRLRGFEKKLFKEINNSNGIKFPIKVDLAMHAHKRSLIIQSELGGVEFPTDEQHAKHKRTFQNEKSLMFANIHRLIRCVVDINVHLQDAVSARHALELARSLSAGVWDNSPFQMKQISQIGPVAIRKFALNGINSIEALEIAEPHRIELLLSKNPPFGSKLLSNLNTFPKLRISIRKMDKDSKMTRPLSVKVKLECGFLNEQAPIYFNRKPVYVCLLTERSDGHLIDFRRISAKKLGHGQEVLISAEMTSHVQHITCYIMCEEIAGTMRSAELRPKLPEHLFPAAVIQPQQLQQQSKEFDNSVTLLDDEFGVEAIDEQDMVCAVEGEEFKDVESFACGDLSQAINGQSSAKAANERTSWNLKPLENGRWDCNHKCKDKTTCKHLCCREGLEKAPKAPRGSLVPASTRLDCSQVQHVQPKAKPQVALSRKTNSLRTGPAGATENVDHANEEHSPLPIKKSSRQVQDLERLHQSVTKRGLKSIVRPKKPSHDFSKDGQLQLSFLTDDGGASSSPKQSTNYSDDWLSVLPSPSGLFRVPEPVHEAAQVGNNARHHYAVESGLVDRTTYDSNLLEDFDQYPSDDERCDMEAAMVGLSDSITMQELSSTQVQDAKTGLSLQSEPSKTNPYHASFPNLPSSVESVGVSRLNKSFHSLDTSAEALPSLPKKRRAEVLPEVEDPSRNFAETKRQKSGNLSKDFPLLRSASLDPLQPALSVPAIIKPGQPAWVYDFDPAFIAEYQDLVDFV